ncbi:unnamed protein product [Arabidopsis lyrata]|nr:unnamed protein product [Arabidopsis lyrata]
MARRTSNEAIENVKNAGNGIAVSKAGYTGRRDGMARWDGEMGRQNRTMSGSISRQGKPDGQNHRSKSLSLKGLER